MFLFLRRNVTCVLLQCLLISMISVHDTASAQDAPDDVAQLKQAVIAWSQSIKSFSGSYGLSQSSFELKEGVMQQESHLEWEIELRHQEENFYFEMELITETGSIHEVCSCYDGVYNTLTGPGEGDLGVVNKPAPEVSPFASGITLSPQEIFGQRDEYTLAEVLSAGDTRLYEKEGRRILSHVNPDLYTAVDITLDGENRVSEIAWVRRPFLSSEEALLAIWEGDPFDLRIKKVTLELSDYRDISGIPFPGKVVKTWWRLDEAGAEIVNADFEAGKISQDELTVKLYTLPLDQVCIQYFTLYNAALNIPLSEGDFAINWPKGARILDAKYVVPGEPLPPEWNWWPYVAGAAAVVVLGILAVILYWRYAGKK